jgi:hypothetical protein
MVIPALMAVGLYAGYRYYTKMKRTQANLVIIPHAKLHKLSVAGITIRLDIQLKNPSSGSFAIQYPFVEVSHKGLQLASSKVINQQIKIPAYGEAWVKEMMLDVPFMGLVSVAVTLLSELNKGRAVNMQVKTVTEVDLGWNKIPVDDIKQIPIQKAKADTK